MDDVAWKQAYFGHVLLRDKKRTERKWRRQEANWSRVKGYFSVGLIVECDQKPFTVIKKVYLVHEWTCCTHLLVCCRHNGYQVVDQNYVKNEDLKLYDEHGLNTRGAIA